MGTLSWLLPPLFDPLLHAEAAGSAVTDRGAQVAPSASRHTKYITNWAACAGRTRASPGPPPLSGLVFHAEAVRGQH